LLFPKNYNKYAMTEPKKPRKPQTSFRTPCVCTLKIELQPHDLIPPIWRRLDVDGRISLGKLHHFIQAAFGWSDSHLHEFIIKDTIYRFPNPEFEDDSEDEYKAFLNRLLAPKDVFTYTYDLGDQWEHRITVEEFITDKESDLLGGAIVLDGARACPPEDVGGVGGYHHFIETLLGSPHSQEAQEMRDWIGPKFDPIYFDIRTANAAIHRMMYNGWGGK
jgi:hypothetical protein